MPVRYTRLRAALGKLDIRLIERSGKGSYAVIDDGKGHSYSLPLHHGHNRRFFKAYYLKEQLERLWSYTYESPMLGFFFQWVRSLRWQRLPAFQELARTLSAHLEGIVSYCRHKVPFGVVEAINGNLRALIRRGRDARARLPITVG